MLFHMYDRSYTDALVGVSKKSLFYVHVFMVADKYDVEALKSRVVEDFAEIAQVYWNDENFLQAIKEGYDLPGQDDDHGLNRIIETICCQNIEALMQKPSFIEAVQASSELQTKIIRTTVDLVKTLKSSVCVPGVNKAIPIAYTCACHARFTESFFAANRQIDISRKDNIKDSWLRCPVCNVNIYAREKRLGEFLYH